jgi:hypothetical protein
LVGIINNILKEQDNFRARWWKLGIGGIQHLNFSLDKSSILHLIVILVGVLQFQGC